MRRVNFYEVMAKEKGEWIKVKYIIITYMEKGEVIAYLKGTGLKMDEWTFTSVLLEHTDLCMNHRKMILEEIKIIIQMNPYG
jgi:hypothetical protein